MVYLNTSDLLKIYTKLSFFTGLRNRTSLLLHIPLVSKLDYEKIATFTLHKASVFSLHFNDNISMLSSNT